MVLFLGILISSLGLVWSFISFTQNPNLPIFLKLVYSFSGLGIFLFGLTWIDYRSRRCVTLRLMNLKWLGWFSLLSLSVILVLIVLIPSSPKNMSYLNRDPGVFQYIGWRILSGEIPYQDVWDHKPPIIFWINALGLWLTKGTRWGIWGLETLSLWISIILGFSLLRRLNGIVPAILATILWPFCFHSLLYGGNYTTEFALPMQFASLLIFWIAEKKQSYSWHIYALGVLSALTFFTRQNAIVISGAILFFITLRAAFNGQWRLSLSYLVRFLLGFGLISFSVIGYFYIYGGLKDFWDAAFIYNFYYSDTTFFDQFSNSINAINYLLKFPIGWMGLLSWFGLVCLLVIRKKGEIKPKALDQFYGLAIIALPLEIFLVNVSGKSYMHYYITCLPLIAVFGAAFFEFFLDGIFSKTKPNKFHWIYYNVFFSLALFSLILTGFRNTYTEIWMDYTTGYGHSEEQERIVEAVKTLSTPEDTVLAWGAEAKYNFLTLRRSPTKFIYQYPLYFGYSNDYASIENILEFLNEIRLNQPKIILVPDYSRFDPKVFGFKSGEIAKAFKFIQESVCIVR